MPKNLMTVDEARDRLSTVAMGLLQVMPAEDAAKAFLGATVTLMRAALGDDFSAMYFRGLSEELLEITDPARRVQ